jgi:hypothetical protein
MSNNQTTTGPVKESLVKYDSPVLVSEKPPTTQVTDKKAKPKKTPNPKQLPPVDPSKTPASQVEYILNSIIPPK